MSRFIQDVRYGLRTLAKNSGFALVAILTIGLGIGTNTTIFSAMNATGVKPLPFPDGERLVPVWETLNKGPDNWNIVSAPNFWDFKRQGHSFQGMALFDSGGRGYNPSATRGTKEAEVVSGLRVSAELFPALGVQPYLGRTFMADEETPGRDQEVVLSYGLWQRRSCRTHGCAVLSIRLSLDAWDKVRVIFRWD